MPHVFVKQKNTKKRVITLFIIIVVLAIGGSLFWWHHRKPAAQVITRAGNFSSSTTPTDPATSSPKKNLNSNTSRNISGGTDTNGQTGANTNPSQWITSTSGNITVEQPLANATIKTGQVLSGTAKVSTVNFRLIDNTDGVISEGTLNVVNGKFSGSLNFTAHSSSGQLDVFSADANGVEINEIQIAVNY